MFKKVSLLAAGAAAEYGGTSKDIDICVLQATTSAAYTTSIQCNGGTVKLEGKDAPDDNDKTDGYTATMSLKFLTTGSSTASVMYMMCVLPVAKTGADDTAYQKAPRAMCLGQATASGDSVVDAAGTAAVTVQRDNQAELMGGQFCHASYAQIVTDNAIKTDTEWTPKSTAQAATQDAIRAQVATTLALTGCTTMNGVKTYGTITTPATTWYDTKSFFTLTTDNPIDNAVTAISAIFMMPTEAETYADVPRLSPADLDGWQGYHTNVANVEFGRLEKQLLVANSSIIDNFATTVAAGVAIVGAAALSF